MNNSGSIDTLAAVALAVNPILLIGLGYMLKRWIERLEATIKEILKTQSECQVGLAKTYRTKAEADSDSAKQWAKIDDHAMRITRLETKIESGA